MGIGSHLLEILERIAKENQYTSFSATVLKENSKMVRVFRKRYPNAKLSANCGYEVSIIMDFDDARPDA